ncbi:hypothetical protein M3Y99_01358300 [Aphelenchoides fujianensis]|nr:hypothetical protein M3Y99_01358300 [Aphelenchoides fujianensis]
MVGRLQAGFPLLFVFSMFVGGAAAADCVRQSTTANYVILKTTADCRSTSTTLVLARESLDFTVRTNGDVHPSKITFTYGSSCSAKAETTVGVASSYITFSGQQMKFSVIGTLNTSALVFSPTGSDESKKTFSCSKPFGKRNATHFTLDVAVEWTGAAPNLDIQFENAAVFEYTTGEILTIAGLSIAGGVGVLLLIGIAAGVFACRRFKWLCWSDRAKTALVAEPAVKTAGSRRSQRAAKAAATPAPLLPTPTPTTITPLSRGLTVRDEPPPPTVEQPAKAEPSTITHSIGLTCHDDPPPRRPIGPPSKLTKKEECCGTKTADAFGLHVHDEAPPKSPKRPKSAGLVVQDKSQPTKTVWTGATVVTEEGSKPSKESAPSGSK